MISLIPGLALVAFGMLCHRRGTRHAAFASERAEYLPANIIVQAAALCWIVPELTAGSTLLLVVGQLIGVVWLASSHTIPTRAADRLRSDPGSRGSGRTMRLDHAWQAARVRTGS